MLRTGQEVKIKSGQWIEARPLRLGHVRWEKVLITASVSAVIESVQDDGWLILDCAAHENKYRCWPTMLEHEGEAGFGGGVGYGDHDAQTGADGRGVVGDA